MRKLLVTGILISFLAACTTERVIEPNDPKRAAELNAQLGLGYLKQGQYKRAMTKLDRALEYDSDNASAYHYRAEVYRRLNEFDKAEEQFARAIELAPKDTTIQNNYAVFLCDTEKYDKAINIFKKSLDDPFNTNKASIHENIGLCRMRQGNITAAQNAFKTALKLNQRLPKSLLMLSQIRFDAGLKQEAYRLFSRYTAIAPHTPESLWLGILLENERGAKNTVASYKVKLKGKYPDSKQTRLLIKLERQGKL